MFEKPLEHMHSHAIDHVLFTIDNPKFTIEERIAYLWYLKESIELFLDEVTDAAIAAEAGAEDE